MGMFNKVKVCEIREVVDESDKPVGCDAATPQGEVQDGLLKGGARPNLSEGWETSRVKVSVFEPAERG